MIKSLSAAAVASSLRARPVRAQGMCVLIPEETEGPYPLDLSASSEFFRQDIAADRSGTPLNLQINLVNLNNNCNPISGARVDVWHCDADGYYSGFSNNGHLGTVNNVSQRFCRGIQLSDTSGNVNFRTVYPGWYPGRATHIHFQVFLDSNLTATSQIAFPESLTAEVYQNESAYAHSGQSNSTTNANDGIFRDGYDAELLAVGANLEGGYDGTLIVGIAGPEGNDEPVVETDNSSNIISLLPMLLDL